MTTSSGFWTSTNAISGTYHGKADRANPPHPRVSPNSATPPACNSFKKQLATRDQYFYYFYGSANYIETHCSVFFSNYLAETRNYPPTNIETGQLQCVRSVP
jgi:hypothetical protein